MEVQLRVAISVEFSIDVSFDPAITTAFRRVLSAVQAHWVEYLCGAGAVAEILSFLVDRVHCR